MARPLWEINLIPKEQNQNPEDKKAWALKLQNLKAEYNKVKHAYAKLIREERYEKNAKH